MTALLTRTGNDGKTPQRKRRAWWAVLLPLLALGALAIWGVSTWMRGRPELRDVGPRLVSNQTDHALTLYGAHFRPGMRLWLGPPVSRALPVAVKGPDEAYAVMPAEVDLPAAVAELEIPVTIEGGVGGASLVVVNDTHFDDPFALELSPNGDKLAAISPTTDALVVIDARTRAIERVRTGDRPTALAAFRDADGSARLAVVHAFSPELRIYAFDAPQAPPRIVAAPTFATGVLVDADGVAYVAERHHDTVRAIALRGAGGRELWRTEVAPNPRELVFADDAIAVGSLGSGEVELLSRSTGERRITVAPTPKVHIVGGGTEKFGSYVMSGKQVRGLAWIPEAKALLVSSIGPNVGPNPERMEVTMNAGVSVVIGEPLEFVRHLGNGAGVGEGLAIDVARGLVYVADIGSGSVRILSWRKLLADDAGARVARLGEVPILPPAGFPTIREGGFGRVGAEIHSGPRALRLSADGGTLYVLDRFTGTLARLDVRDAPKGSASVVEQLPLFSTLTQPQRRLGQVLYHADLGRSGMSCDTCHAEGETEGVLFEKTHPLRIYRSVGIRGARYTPPYFNPASTFSLEQTMREVGARNRYHRVEVTPPEVERVAAFARALATWPNPNRGPDGAPLEPLALPWGGAGSPARGRALFNARGCPACHPPPIFTLDQDPATRGRYPVVGTPNLLPLREAQQELLQPGFAIPSLIGLWDQFPLLGTGSGGFSVRPDGTLAVQRAPLGALLEHSGPQHGDTAALSPAERNDLGAYLLSL